MCRWESLVCDSLCVSRWLWSRTDCCGHCGGDLLGARGLLLHLLQPLLLRLRRRCTHPRNHIEIQALMAVTDEGIQTVFCLTLRLLRRRGRATLRLLLLLLLLLELPQHLERVFPARRLRLCLLLLGLLGLSGLLLKPLHLCHRRTRRALTTPQATIREAASSCVQNNDQT